MMKTIKSFGIAMGIILLAACTGPEADEKLPEGAIPYESYESEPELSEDDDTAEIAEKEDVNGEGNENALSLAQNSVVGDVFPRINPETRESHLVAAGETLWSISQLWGTTVEQIQMLNNLGTSTDIRTGQLLDMRNLDAEILPARHPFAVSFSSEILEDKNEGMAGTWTEFDFSQVATHEEVGGITLALWTDIDLFEVAFIDPGWNSETDFGFDHTLGDVFPIGNLAAGEKLLITNWYDRAGSIPMANALRVKKADGTQLVYYFGFNNAYPNHGGIIIFIEAG